MENCWFVHSDNIDRARDFLNLKVAVIARPDWFMQETECQHLIIETPKGIHARCYLLKSNENSFLLVYGRFGQKRTPSSGIDYELTQEAISFLGIKIVIGTFSVGSIREDDQAGAIYVPSDFVGLGGYNEYRNRDGFRNVDMLRPFCVGVRNELTRAAETVDFPVVTNGIYACFHGYPRIETEAELNFYKIMGWDIVGQTLDPEATLARESGCHYAAIAATIDDRRLRSRFFANDPSARKDIDFNIIDGRRKTFSLFIEALPNLTEYSEKLCNCLLQEEHVKSKSNFYCRPSFLCD